MAIPAIRNKKNSKTVLYYYILSYINFNYLFKHTQHSFLKRLKMHICKYNNVVRSSFLKQSLSRKMRTTLLGILRKFREIDFTKKLLLWFMMYNIPKVGLYGWINIVSLRYLMMLFSFNIFCGIDPRLSKVAMWWRMPSSVKSNQIVFSFHEFFFC